MTLWNVLLQKPLFDIFPPSDESIFGIALVFCVLFFACSQTTAHSYPSKDSSSLHCYTGWTAQSFDAPSEKFRKDFLSLK